MSRRVGKLLGLCLAMGLGFAAPVAAQTAAVPAGEAQTGTPPERIDLMVKKQVQGPQYEDCSREQEAALISGTIVVCRRKNEDDNRLTDKETAANRYAERTRDKGAPRAPEMFGIPNHGVVVARGCFIPPCPPPMAVMIDLKAIPEAPPGSDADRIARGLAPRGYDVATPQSATARAQELGLPDATPSAAPVPVSPSESASPEAEPSD